MSTGLIPKPFIQELLARIDIVEVIGQYVTLKKRGQSYLACCPFHQEKTPSFNVNGKKQFYHCFGCHESGDAIAFVMAYEHLSFIAAVEKLSQQVGIAIPYQKTPASSNPQRHEWIARLNQVVDFYQQALQRSQVAQAYLKQRGLGNKVAHFKLGFAPPGWDNLLRQMPQQQQILAATGMLIAREQGEGYYDRFRHRIMFPILNAQGDCIAFGGRVLDEGQPKYLNSPETPLFFKSHELYGLYQALNQHRELPDMMIVEGYMDVLGLVQHGYSRVVATLGTATTPQHLEILYRYTPIIIFCFDGDKAGRSAAWRALTHVCPLLQDGREAKFIVLPEQEDPDSFIRREGLEAWQQLVDGASTAGQFLFSQLRYEIPLNTFEGRAKFAQRAMVILNTIPSLTLQGLLLEELAKVTRLTHDLSKVILASSDTNTTKLIAKRRYSSLTCTQLACAFLLQYPELIRHLHSIEWLLDLKETGAELLLSLVESLQEYAFSSTAQILSHYHGQPAYEMYQQLACHAILCPSDGIEQEFNDMIQRLRHSTLDNDITQLMQKAAGEPLTLSEKTLLQDLLRKRKSIKT